MHIIHPPASIITCQGPMAVRLSFQLRIAPLLAPGQIPDPFNNASPQPVSFEFIATAGGGVILGRFIGSRVWQKYGKYGKRSMVRRCPLHSGINDQWGDETVDTSTHKSVHTLVLLTTSLPPTYCVSGSALITRRYEAPRKARAGNGPDQEVVRHTLRPATTQGHSPTIPCSYATLRPLSSADSPS